MLRLFVGITLPPEHRLALTALCSGLHGVRWVDPGNFHVTLRFIGEIDEALADEMAEALAAIQARKFALTVAGLGLFGPAEKPRLLYTGLDREPALLHLRDRIEAALASVGLPPEGRRYTPHVTLGQFKAPNAAEIQDYIRRNNLVRLPSFAVEGFHLIRSYLTKAGSVYEDIADYPLR